MAAERFHSVLRKQVVRNCLQSNWTIKARFRYSKLLILIKKMLTREAASSDQVNSETKLKQTKILQKTGTKIQKDSKARSRSISFRLTNSKLIKVAWFRAFRNPIILDSCVKRHWLNRALQKYLIQLCSNQYPKNHRKE